MDDSSQSAHEELLNPLPSSVAPRSVLECLTSTFAQQCILWFLPCCVFWSVAQPSHDTIHTRIRPHCKLARRRVETARPFRLIWAMRFTKATTMEPQDLMSGEGNVQFIPRCTSLADPDTSIRFAAPPTGALRWQAPQVPQTNRSSVLQANQYAPFCPQSGDASLTVRPVNSTGASEDCLFVNVYAPPNPSAPLPVLVWIHGGGYGGGNGRQDLSAIINANNNSFVGVTIQYRVRSMSLSAGRN